MHFSLEGLKLSKSNLAKVNISTKQRTHISFFFFFKRDPHESKWPFKHWTNQCDALKWDLVPFLSNCCLKKQTKNYFLIKGCRQIYKRVLWCTLGYHRRYILWLFKHWLSLGHSALPLSHCSWLYFFTSRQNKNNLNNSK